MRHLRSFTGALAATGVLCFGGLFLSWHASGTVLSTLHAASTRLSLGAGLVSVVVALVAAFFGGTSRRFGMAGLESVSPRSAWSLALRHTLRPLGALTLVFVVWVATVVVVHYAAGRGGVLLLQPVLTGWAVLLLATMVGFCAGRLLRSWHGPLTVGVAFAVVGLLTLGDSARNVLIPYDAAGYVWNTVRWSVTAFKVMLVVCVVAAAVAWSGVMLNRSAGKVRRGKFAWPVLFTGAACASVAVLVTLPTDVVQRKGPQNPVCSTHQGTSSFTVCTWPETAHEIPAMTEAISRYHNAVKGTSLPVFDAYVEPGLRVDSDSSGTLIMTDPPYAQGNPLGFLPSAFTDFETECGENADRRNVEDMSVYIAALLNGSGLRGVEAESPSLGARLTSMSDTELRQWEQDTSKDIVACRS